MLQPKSTPNSPCVCPDASVVIAKLVGVSRLWYLAFEVIADGEAARDADERNTLAGRTEIGCDSSLGSFVKTVGVSV